ALGADKVQWRIREGVPRGPGWLTGIAEKRAAVLESEQDVAGIAVPVPIPPAVPDLLEVGRPMVGQRRDVVRVSCDGGVRVGLAFVGHRGDVLVRVLDAVEVPAPTLVTPTEPGSRAWFADDIGEDGDLENRVGVDARPVPEAEPVDRAV